MLCYVEKEVESGAVGCLRAEAEMALVLWGHRLRRNEMPVASGQGAGRAACQREASCPKQGLLQGQGWGCCCWLGQDVAVSFLGKFGPRHPVGAQGCAVGFGVLAEV